ncbi:MAG: thiamine pyrophosphate-dependent enzyme, partial [Nanoarchaeota archaeon]
KNVERKPLKITPTSKSIPHDIDMKKALTLIKESKHPVILVGNGVIRANAVNELKRFAEKNTIYTANTFMSKGVLPNEHKLSLFTVGMQAKDYVMCYFEKADLVITIGYDIVEYAPSFWNPKKDKKIVHIGSEPCEVEEHYQVDVELIGDIKYTLEKLTELSGFNKGSDYAKRLREIIIKDFGSYENNMDFPLKPQKVLLDLRKAMKNQDILISDVGAHKIWISRMFKAIEPNTVIISNGFAAMGIAIPGAVAAKIAMPKKRVIAVTGDGGFLMNAQEIETAKRLGLAIVILVFNDQRYGLTEWKQVLHLKKSFGQRFTNPDFIKFAESFGAVGFKVKSANELLPTLNKALATNNVVIIDVPIDFEENFRLSEKLSRNVCLGI